MKKIFAVIAISITFGITPITSFAYEAANKTADAPKTSFLSWLTKTFLPEKNTNTLKDQCSNPAGQDDCTLPDEKTKGYCSGVIGENKKCVPWMYAQAPKALPQSPPPVNPATHIIPCTTGGGAIESSSDSENGVACAYKPGGCEKWDPNSPTGIYLACSPKAYQKYKKAWDDSVQATKDAIRNTGINPDQKIIMRLLASHGDFGTATDYSFDEVVRQCSYDSYKYTSPTCQNSRIRQFTDVMQKEADAKQKADQVLKKDLADCEDSKPDDLYRNQNECIKKQVCVGP